MDGKSGSESLDACMPREESDVKRQENGRYSRERWIPALNEELLITAVVYSSSVPGSTTSCSAGRELTGSRGGRPSGLLVVNRARPIIGWPGRAPLPTTKSCCTVPFARYTEDRE